MIYTLPYHLDPLASFELYTPGRCWIMLCSIHHLNLIWNVYWSILLARYIFFLLLLMSLISFAGTSNSGNILYNTERSILSNVYLKSTNICPVYISLEISDQSLTFPTEILPGIRQQYFRKKVRFFFRFLLIAVSMFLYCSRIRVYHFLSK